ncbi:TolC family protein [Sulfurimonas sp. HSL-1716]|uniref:TolC family protein n=1 Tax=Hydrocurvibacter sulfurireducens TaxID=3131937 RepID=UPI0031F74FB8
MLKKIVLSTLVTFSLQASETVVDFYRSALENLHYNQKEQLLRQAGDLEKKALNLNRFADFSLDAGYSSTKADRLPSSFNTTDVSFTDTIDIFGKDTYKIDELKLNLKEQKTLLKKQKEELFVSLTEMISAYRQTQEQLALHTDFLNGQLNILDKIKRLNSSGTVSDMDYLRLKNSVTLFKTQITDETNRVKRMQEQLMLYTAQSIPSFDKNETLHCSQKAYLKSDPNTQLNSIAAAQLANQANVLSHSYVPRLTAGTSYQKIDDPTANGDNYSFHVGISIPLKSGDLKQSEALRVRSLRVSFDAAKYRLQRKKEYIQRMQSITNAVQQLRILKESLDDSLKSKKIIQEAFLKKYVDFNTYVQVVSQTLTLQEQIIKMRYLKDTQTAILNTLSSGALYE